MPHSPSLLPQQQPTTQQPTPGLVSGVSQTTQVPTQSFLSQTDAARFRLTRGDIESQVARAEQTATSAARARIGDASFAAGGDVTNPLFRFLAQTSIAGARAQSAQAGAQIRINEARRSQDAELRRQQVRLGFEGLNFQQRSQQDRLRFQAQTERFGQRFQTEQLNLNRAQLISRFNPQSQGFQQFGGQLGGLLRQQLGSRRRLGPAGVNRF